MKDDHIICPERPWFNEEYFGFTTSCRQANTMAAQQRDVYPGGIDE